MKKKGSWQTVFDGVKEDIVYGRLMPKEHLPEDDLIARYSVSRYAVRRALDELQAIGLVVRHENRGIYIRSYSPEEVIDLYDMREVLESAAAARIQLPVAPALIAELCRIQTKYDQAAGRMDLTATQRLNELFHQTLYTACPNDILRQQITYYALQTEPVRMRFFLEEDRRERASLDHWEIIDALKGSDSDRLTTICARHISESKEQYLRTTLTAVMSA